MTTINTLGSNFYGRNEEDKKINNLDDNNLLRLSVADNILSSH
jgi:hypothetical protein